MSTNYFVVFGCILTLLGSACGAAARDYTCPAPELIGCVPTPVNIPPWKSNGGTQMGNAFVACPVNTAAVAGGIQLHCCY